MDQWTSRSINLIVEGPALVKMRTQNDVDPRNDETTYEGFCAAIEELARRLANKTPEETEQCLFSTGGRNPDPWRRYVLQNGG